MPAQPSNGFFCPLGFAKSAGDNSLADESAYLIVPKIITETEVHPSDQGGEVPK